MKRIKAILACGLVLAVAGLATLVVAAGAMRETKATCRAVHGDVSYAVAGGQLMKLRPNMELPAGSKIVTGADSYADFLVNGRTSTVRVTADTTMTMEKMEAMSAGFDADTETMLKLDTGTILGSIKKVSGDSRYEIETPHGVAGVRGTDVQVTVILNVTTGTVTVTFTSVTGQVICSAVISGLPITKILNTGEKWTVGDENIVKLDVAELDPLIKLFTQIGPVTVIVTGPPGPPIIVYIPPTTTVSTVGGTGTITTSGGEGETVRR